MSLTGSLLERTQQAIVAAFGRAELEQFVRIHLDVNFEAIVRDHNLRVQAYELLLWAGRHGRERELLDKLLLERPKNADLAAVATALAAGQPLIPPGVQVADLPGRGPVPLQKPLRAQHFTGRDLELARLLADLQPGKQLTLCGPGGMGKTALAAEAVWRLVPGDEPPERFPDGVIFHTFYHQPQAATALEAITRACGVEPRPTPRDAARMALAGRRALLILDGAEAADDLDAVLQVAGSCGVLIATLRRGCIAGLNATQRRRNGRSAEHRWPTAKKYQDNLRASFAVSVLLVRPFMVTRGTNQLLSTPCRFDVAGKQPSKQASRLALHKGVSATGTCKFLFVL